MKRKIDFAFVILTYRNLDDIIECLDSIKANHFGTYEVVIVDSYYDDTTRGKISEIAKANDAVFISVENKGYGHGNNAGIKYCTEHFDFDFLVVCNPDILVKKNQFDFSRIKDKKIIIAPCIRNRNGKRQNPYWTYRRILFIKMIYRGYLHYSRLLMFAGIGGYKIERTVFGLSKHDFRKIYAAHGSFLIFTKPLLETLRCVYDENVFLFTEEAILAKRMMELQLETYYTDSIEITHKEDGSMSLAKINEMEELRKSYLYYVERYETNG